MRKSRDETAATRQRIIESARLEFHRHGIDGSGLTGLMAAAGLTQGGFYKHFASKSALVAESVTASVDELLDSLRELLPEAGEAGAFKATINGYLSKAHRDHDKGCPYGALASELARAEPGVRVEAVDGLERMISLLSAQLSGSGGTGHRDQALFAMCAMMGALTVSRIAAGMPLSDEALVAARKYLGIQHLPHFSEQTMIQVTPQIMADLAPEGVLRAAINFGNPVLAQQGPDGGPQGISVALAKALADELGVRLEMLTFDAAGKVFAALEEGAWNVAFLAIEPVREEQIAFSEPYVIIEGTYLVAADSPYLEVADLDQPGLRLAVGKGAAYDLFLSRTLQHAQLERAETSAAAVELYFSEGLDAAAGVRQPLQKVAAADANYRVLDGAFTSIRQAMAVPRQRVAGAAYVRAFLERKKADGFVHAALVASGQGDVTVAV